MKYWKMEMMLFKKIKRTIEISFPNIRFYGNVDNEPLFAIIFYGRNSLFAHQYNVCGAFVKLHSLDSPLSELNIAKGTMDPRVEFISQVLTQIFIKFQFQNLD